MGNRWPQFTQKCSSVTTWSSDFINGLSYDHVFFFSSGHIQQFSCIFFFLQFCLLNKAQRAILASDDKMYPSGAGADPSGQWWCQDTPWMVCISWPHRDKQPFSDLWVMVFYYPWLDFTPTSTVFTLALKYGIGWAAKLLLLNICTAKWLVLTLQLIN